MHVFVWSLFGVNFAFPHGMDCFCGTFGALFRCRFFCDFSIFPLKRRVDWPWRPQGVPQRLPEAPKRLPRGPPEALHTVGIRYKRHIKTPKAHQQAPRGPKGAPRRFKTAPRAPQEHPKSTPRGSKSTPRATQEGPRAPQQAPRGAQERPKTVQKRGPEAPRTVRSAA